MAGGIIVLMITILLIIFLLWKNKKRSQRLLNASHSLQIPVDRNVAYNQNEYLISLDENVAYVGTKISTKENVAYGHFKSHIPGEDNKDIYYSIVM